MLSTVGREGWTYVGRKGEKEERRDEGREGEREEDGERE